MVSRTFSDFAISGSCTYLPLPRLYLPEVACPSGSDEKWQRVDDGDQDEGFWLRRGGSVVLKHKVSTLTFSYEIFKKSCYPKG